MTASQVIIVTDVYSGQVSMNVKTFHVSIYWVGAAPLQGTGLLRATQHYCDPSVTFRFVRFGTSLNRISVLLFVTTFWYLLQVTGIRFMPLPQKILIAGTQVLLHSQAIGKAF